MVGAPQEAAATGDDARRVLLIVTGGIAAYKAAELVRELRRRDCSVQVAMTAGAQRFVTPLTFQALSGHPVHSELLDPHAEAGMGHIELARWAEAVVVAPATADFLARLAHGRADDLPAALCLATRAPLTVAPAMNVAMWTAAATRDNLATLRRRGVQVVGPAAGEQACGEFGEGRMSAPEEIVAALFTALNDSGGAAAACDVNGGPTLGRDAATSDGDATWGGASESETAATPAATHAGTLAGRTVLITAGPTREPLDPVRYLTNRSSGRMGFAVAAAARAAGARVTLVAGPCALPTPDGVERVDVERAAEMHAAVMARIADADLFIATAAVCDYRPLAEAAQKIKKDGTRLELCLETTEDIVGAVAARRPRPFVVGFAAETEKVIDHARAKLMRKGLDLIAANQVGPQQGFDAATNRLEVLWDGGRCTLPEQPKSRLAEALMAVVIERFQASR